ncbi:hypothetical protein MSAN_01516900 [Mycena sanguinolenta]|uniref:Uncharacterized protein n=1 Tax=Mycena sanguinolenta TaxID=230812 RepID=A0A8H7CWN8_9AGAR|nr:hypothetical protein MSAN_01516900 [Mycena sanguinolenta]
MSISLAASEDLVERVSTEAVMEEPSGDSAEEEWRKHVATYELMWHPHIIQLYGLVSTKGLYATVFDGELIPCDQFFRPFSTLAYLEHIYPGLLYYGIRGGDQPYF